MNRKKRSVLALLMVLSIVGSGNAAGFLTLPFANDFSKGCGYGCYPGHLGTDWPMPQGSWIIAPHDAVVEFARDNDVPNYSFESGIRSFGNYIKLDLGNINGRRVKVVLAHLLHGSFKVSQSQQVVQGQLLALSGNSGTSTAPHLDMTVYINDVAVDPYSASDWLWSSNPPKPGYKNYHWDFPNHSPQSWSLGNGTSISFNYGLDQHTFQVIAQGSNPGIVSPVIENGRYTTKQLSILQFSVKARSDVCRQSKLQVLVKDNSGSWNHGLEKYPVYVGSVAERRPKIF